MIRLVLLSLILLLFPSCAEKGLQPGEGYVEVTGGEVWYRIVGSGTNTPLLLLQGGPGVPSYYMKPLARLADERPVILYDQLGAGRSDSPSDTSLWRLERFVEELQQVRDALGLREVYILGHSWGAMLVVEYMLTNPQGVRGLIIASSCLSISRFKKDTDSLITTLPDSTQEIIRKHESAGTTNSPEHQSAVSQYYARYMLRHRRQHPDLDSTSAQFNYIIYKKMWGEPSSLLSVTGSLKNYERVDALPNIDIPVLYTTGRFDTCTPATVEYFHSLTPNSRMEVIENSGHMTYQDEPERSVDVVREFLREVDANR
ncbi:MAG: proline iminopeptidase-family hydrolase [Chloroflexi bacterium]|jgi:proline-specific peptidase|nr:proline iminopeptidase-family hydrolase [Chloroflexota bacterium]